MKKGGVLQVARKKIQKGKNPVRLGDLGAGRPRRSAGGKMSGCTGTGFFVNPQEMKADTPSPRVRDPQEGESGGNVCSKVETWV